MLNRSWPRSITCGVSVNGSVVIFDRSVIGGVALPSGLYGAVPSTSCRADFPSLKKRLGASGLYFGWFRMSLGAGAAEKIRVIATGRRRNREARTRRQVDKEREGGEAGEHVFFSFSPCPLVPLYPLPRLCGSVAPWL